MHKNNLDYKDYLIIDKTELAPEIFLFRFKGKINFMPGQFVQVGLSHYGEATFAICSDPEAKDYFELCIRGCGSTTNQLIKLLPGDRMKIRGPYGKGWPIARLLGKEIILIAGGMGIVPLRPLMFEILHNKSEFKKINMAAGFKTSDHVLFAEELLAFKKSTDQTEVYVESKTKDFWGEKGRITDGLEKIKFQPQKAIALICGPEIMFSYCNDVLLGKNLSEKDIYISFERRMECGIGICQHCNIGKFLVCEDGPVFPLDQIKNELKK